MSSHNTNSFGDDLTLRQALVAYREANDELAQENKVSPEAAVFFHSHDICHVLFGCSNELVDEALADTWSLFGTTLTLKEFLGFLKLEEHKEIMREVGVFGALRTSVKACPKILKVIHNSRKMSKKWPWNENESLLDKKLSELRSEFNIELVH